MAFKPSIPKLSRSADGKSFGIRDWRVFGPGLWNGEPFSPARIKGIVETYRLVRGLIPSFSPKLRLGHDTKQRLAQQLGLPNAGRVIDARLADGQFIDVDIDGIPCTALASDGKGGVVAFDIEQAFLNGNYDGGSIEMKRRTRHPLNPTQTLLDVFDGIALIGEEHPACKTSGAPAPSPSADLNRLAFSDFTEEMPVNPQLQAMADAIKALPPDQLDALMALVQAKPAGMADDTCNPDMTAKFSELMAEVVTLRHRCTTNEAALDDMRKVAAGNASNGMVTFSEACGRIDRCVAAGRFPRVIGEAKKTSAKELLALPSNLMTFSDGEHAGKSQIAVFLAELEARPADAMFTEIIDDTPNDGSGGGLDAGTRRRMALTREGRAELAWHDAQAKTAKV